MPTVGFWSDKLRPQDLVDPSWKGPERKVVLAFIKAGHSVHYYKGWADCRICGEKLGSCDLQLPLGWVCPDMFDHYLIAHRVKPPRNLIKAAIRWSHLSPAQKAKLREESYDE